MGRAARWLRGLLGGKRAVAGDAKPEKRKWGFVKSFREKETAAAPPAVQEERRGSYREAIDEEAQSRRAIEVAAATAAVAEAAVAAAQAAAVVVKLTSSSGWSAVGFRGARGEVWGAVKIQAAFRGYLARRALRALRGLVKLQALVRGNIVRKQAAETLRCMHALVRVQARARACRAIRSERGSHNKPSCSHPGPPTPEAHEPPRSISFKRSSSKGTSADSERAQSSGWNWLDRWMEERYWDSRESATKVMMEDEKNAKILEIDNGKPKRRTSSNQHYPQSSCSTVTSDRNSRSFATVVDSPSVDSSAAQHCVPSPSSVDKPQQQPPSPLGFPILIEAGEYMGESPQFFSASSRPGSSRGPFTPAKSECARSLFSAYADYPNYMSYTESSRAKVRSQSAPRQRADFDKSGGLKRMSAPGAVPSQKSSSSSVQTKFANKAYPGSGRLDRLGMPIRY